MNFIEKYWAIIAANPVPFIIFGFVLIAGTWAVASLYYSGQVAATKAQADLAEKQRDDFKSKLSVASPDEAKTKVDRLEGELKGLNRIIAITSGYDWVALTPEQINNLSAQLATLPKHRVQIMYLNLLGRDLAQSFHIAFQKAGWDGATFSEGGGAHTGIFAGPGNKMAAAVQRVVEATTPHKVHLDKPNSAEVPNLIYFFVGINPNRP